MSTNSFSAPGSNSDVDIFELWKVVWRKKFHIVVTATAFVIVVGIHSYLQPDIFLAEAIVAPAEAQSQMNGLPFQLDLGTNFPSLGSLQNRSNTQNALAILQSRLFLTGFIRKHGLSVALLASKWDYSKRMNVIDSEIYDVENESWILPAYQPFPSSWQLYNAFSRILLVDEDVETGLYSISIEWSDPNLAADWVNMLVFELNEALREKDQTEAEQAISFLKEQINSTQLLEMQRIFYQLLESETRTLMLADAREEYIFITIDPAISPEQKVKPRRLLIVLLGGFVGLVVAIFIVVIAHLAGRSDN